VSYARKGRDGSAVYVWCTGTEWICQECPLAAAQGAPPEEGFDGPFIRVGTPGAMLAHLQEHLARGEHVPDSALERLTREAAEWGDRPPVNALGESAVVFYAPDGSVKHFDADGKPRKPN
jgi:hypothetical protein